MGICIITNEFPPWKLGGISTWAEALAVRLSDNGENRVTVLLRRGKIDRELPPVHEKINYVLMYGRSWKNYHFFYTYFYMWKYLKKHPSSVVIAANWKLARCVQALKSKYNPLLITAAHGKEVSQLRQEHKDLILFRNVIRASDAILAVSSYTKQEIIRAYSRDPGNIYFLPNGTDDKKYKPLPPSEIERLRKKHGIEKNQLVLLTIARVIPRKGHDVVIKSLPKVLKDNPNVVYIITGKGSSDWNTHLTTLAKENNAEGNVRLTGPVSEVEKLELYRLCNIYIMVSKSPEGSGDSEGFGITFLEANACGKPVIGSNTGGIPDAVEHNVSGLLVDPENTDQTADAILKLANDKQLRDKLGTQGRRRVEEQFTWDQVVKQIRLIIEDQRQNG